MRLLVRVMRSALAALVTLLSTAPAPAIVGDAPAAPPALARHVVMLVGSRGTSCTASVIAPRLVLTAAHCVQPGADYKLVTFDDARRPSLLDVADVRRHPEFAMATLAAHRASADVALIRTARPLPASFVPARLASTTSIVPGAGLTVAGTGLAVRGDGRTGGTVRAATLVATGKPGTLQLRLHDPATAGERPGLGACTGDSGAPVFRDEAGAPAIVGVVSWSTGPKLAAGCGGLTGVTPLARHRAWIVETARALGEPLAP